MLKCTNANITSLIIGFFWGMWHLPLFYMLGTSQHELGVPFIAFFISVLSTSFIYTYFYKRNNASVFSAIFLHWVYTYVLQVVSSSVTRTTLYNWLEIVPAVIIGVVFAYMMRKDKAEIQQEI